MGRNTSRGKVAYSWISPDPAKAGPTLGIVVVVVIEGQRDGCKESILYKTTYFLNTSYPQGMTSKSSPYTKNKEP